MKLIKAGFNTLPCLLLVLGLVWVQTARAEEYRNFHRGVRPLGMGGAFTAVANDHNSRYYNPAGLANAGGFGLGLINPMVSVSENSIDLITDFQDANTDDTAEVNNLLRKYVGENNNFKISLDPYIGFNVRNIGVALTVIANSDTDVNIHNPVWPEATITSVVDYGLMLGAGMEIPAVRGLKVGASLKTLTRESLNKTYTAIDIADEDEDFADKIEDDMESGTGISLDIGVLYAVSGVPFTDLTLAFTGQNLPDMDFGDALDSKSQFNMGAAFSQQFGMVTLTEAIDYMDITDNLAGDNSLEKKLHLGVEAKMPVVAVRMGLNQGYYTLGATLDLWIFRFDVASYGEEVGVYGGQKEDRRLVGQISTGWSW